MPDHVVEFYADDNDSKYREYRPRRINKATIKPAVKQPEQEKVIYVPVPMPAMEENDAVYTPPGQYNPNPLNYSAPAVEAPAYDGGQIPLPIPSETEDFDNQDSLYYYQ